MNLQKYTIGSVVIRIPLDTMTGLEGARVTVDGNHIGTIHLSNTTLGVVVLPCNIKGQVSAFLDLKHQTSLTCWLRSHPYYCISVSY